MKPVSFNRFPSSRHHSSGRPLAAGPIRPCRSRGAQGVCLHLARLCTLGAATALLTLQPTLAGNARTLPVPSITVSTIPTNGDVNPYGVAFVPNPFPTGGVLNPGDILVSNFNDAQNIQGTGTTITRVTPAGQKSSFFQGSPPLGL